MATMPRTAPAPDQRIVTLTPSQAEILDRCPFQYGARYLRRLLPEARTRTPQLAMGESVHACLSQFHKRGGHQRFTRQDMAALLAQRWRCDGYADAAQEAAFRITASSMCAAYYDASRDEPVRHLGHELFLSATIRLADVQLQVRGKIDRLSLWPDGHLEVIDYKTGTDVPDQADLADALPPFLYFLLVRRAYPTYDRVDVSYLHLGPMVRRTVAYDRERCLASKDRLVQAVTQVAQGALPPLPNPFCRTCPVRHHCPSGREEELELDALL